MSAAAKAYQPTHKSFWLWVMCLTGVDYFSTLGYQPSIAFEATGMLTPLATIVLVAVTLFGALPVYSQVAAQSPNGQGSIAMLERLVRGWGGKFLVLALLGFAATDFVITKTLSAADAAKHLLENPLWIEYMPSAVSSQLGVTIFLLIILGAVFLRGFREVIGLAVFIVGAYLLLNLIILLACGLFLLDHPAALFNWYERVTTRDWSVAIEPAWIGRALPGTDWWTIAAICVLLFPKLALGLSGFETGVAVMPHIRTKPGDERTRLRSRIWNARKLLFTAAVIMSFFLLGSSLVTSTLIDPQDFGTRSLVDPETGEVHVVKGKAIERALAHLAHDEARGPSGEVISPIFGEIFGTIYDLSTVVILWFAGASAMSGLLSLVPQYLPGYGMAPEWARALKPLVVLFTFINLLVTLAFNADATAQGGAYATGVLVLMSSACVATVIHFYRDRRTSLFRMSARYVWLLIFGVITVVFIYTTITIIIEKPDGILISACFIAAIWIASMISRTIRSTELRFMGFEFVDEQSRFLWDSLKHLEFPVLVPHRPGSRELAAKEESIRREHHLTPDIPIVFLEVELGDVSDFWQSPLMEVKHEEERFIISLRRCASIAHVIAAVSLELSKVGKPPEIHFGWSNESPLAANVGFILFGEGNVPWMVRELINRAEPDPERRPRIVIG
jgi:hypothetical protein